MKKAGAASDIYLPGEIEHNKEVESMQSGILLDDDAVKALNQLESIESPVQLTPLG